MIGWEVKRVYEGKQEFYTPLVCHEGRLPSTAIRFKSYVRLSSIYDTDLPTWEAVGDERMEFFPGGAVLLVSTDAGDKEGDCDFVDVLSRLVSGHK